MNPDPTFNIRVGAEYEDMRDGISVRLLKINGDTNTVELQHLAGPLVTDKVFTEEIPTFRQKYFLRKIA